ncbi:MAG: hypothetical protein IT548_15765 [Alphaproteobacteria bacterium]|nr:hypothetical protein [Alphaproteobacteria bacterium]
MPEAMQQLCARLCGGVWVPELPPVPDQFVTRYSFAWDGAAGLIRGTVATTGGVAGIHEEVLVVYGSADAAGVLWTLRASGKSRPVYGTVTLGADGFIETTRVIDGLPGTMTSSYVFDGPDRFTLRSEIAAPNGHVLSTAENYRRQRD